MGVAFSQSSAVGLPFAGVPSPRQTAQRQGGGSSPLPQGVLGLPDAATLCSTSERSSDFPSIVEAAFAAASASATRAAATGIKLSAGNSSSSSNNNNNNCGTPHCTLAQQLQQSLKALSLDWSIIDGELSSITVLFAASLLTSRLRVQRQSSRGGEAGDASPNELRGPHGGMGDCTGDAPAGVDAAAFLYGGGGAAAAAAGTEEEEQEEDVGPQELYVSATLRLAALQLGRDGLQRVIVALAYLANGGESREERRMRRAASLNNATASGPIRRAESSLQELHHFQRGAGYTGAISAAGPSSSGTLNNPAAGAGGGGSAYNASGSAFPSLASSGSAAASRRFSTAPHSHATQLGGSARGGNSSLGGPPASTRNHNNSSNGNGQIAQASTTSVDHLSYTSPVRGGAGASTSTGPGYPHMLRQPSSGRSIDEAAFLHGTNTLWHRPRSVSPLNALTAGPGHLPRPRHLIPESDLTSEEHSYNNMLLTSMNARSTLVSPLRTGPHGELLYSSSSFATLMSLSTGAGAGRACRGPGADHHNANGALRSPVSPYLYSATQWVIPPAPLGGQAASIGGLASANSSIPNSLSSMASPPSAPDSRRRSQSYSRRLIQPLSPYQISRLSVVGAAGVLSRPASEEANLNALLYHLPQAVGGGGGGVVGLDAYSCSGYDGGCGRAAAAGTSDGAGVDALFASGMRDAALQFLRPEAVLTALCSVFAHLQLSADDVTNLVTLLVVAALEVQADAHVRRLVEMDEEVGSESLRMPSMKVVRTAVADALAMLLAPLYRKTRLSLCAAAGMMDASVHAAPLTTDAGEGLGRTQHPPLKPHLHAGDIHNPHHAVSLPPVVPPASLAQDREEHAGVPASLFLNTFPYDAAADPPEGTSGRSLHDASLTAHAHALHDFFEGSVPLESTPSANNASPTTAAAGAATNTTARAMAARRITSAPRGSGLRSQPTHQAAAKAMTATGAALYAHSSYSDSAAGPTSSGSMSRSDIADAIGNLQGNLPCRADAAAVTAPSQEEVRLASSFLMDMEAAFVLHYAEVIAEGEAGKHRSSTTSTTTAASSEPSSPASPMKRLRQRTGSIHNRPTLHTPSSPSLTATTSTTASAKSYPWRRRSDGDPDLFVQLSSNATVWPLRTRLLVRRHEYAYVYDAMASTMALLREESLYATTESTTATSAADVPAKTASRVPHPHTPIALIDLNKATVKTGANDLQVLSGPGDVEVVSLMPSRVSRNSLASHARRTSSRPGSSSNAIAHGGSLANVPSSQPSTPNSGSFTNLLLDHTAPAAGTTHVGSSSSGAVGAGGGRAVSNVGDVLQCCWADAYQQDTEVYRMKGSTGTMYLLTVPAEADRVMVPVATTSPSRASQGGCGDKSAAAATEDVVRASVIRSFERNRLVRPAVLSLASTATTAKETEKRVGQQSEDATRGTAGKGPRVQCAYNDGNSEVLSLELGSEPTRIAAYPLRLIYSGILHHFFFPNPSARDHWYQQLLQLSWMTQSKAYLDTVAAAPHDVGRFLRNRISFPTGPGAFECLDMLGAGTFGRVLLVQHKLSKRLFAMKVIRKSGFHGVRNIIEARREKKILDLLDCPYIMKIHSSFQTDSRVYMLFDYLPGAELLLHTQSAHSNHFDETTSRFYIAELAIAVEYLRVRGIVHRDIKGDNLVLDAEGHVVLTDFGFAKNILSTSAASVAEPGAPLQVVRQHTSCGTLAYIAPEVLSNSRRRSGYGLAVDWWSLGVVLFTFLTGYFPFLKQSGPETSQAIVASPLQFPPRPALSDDARSLLDQLLQKDPEKRIACLADMRHHRFFEGFDWAACRERRLPPPLVLHKDSYRNPRTTADARQLLQDRVRRSLAWSTGASAVPYLPPSHSRRSASDKVALKHQPQLEEEQAELKLVEQAYGAESMPKPLSSLNDVFGPLFEQQERCGSDRDESDAEDLGMEDYVADLAHPTITTLRRLKDGDVSQELCSSLSDLSLNSSYPEYAYAGMSGEEKGAAMTLHGKVAGMPTPPLFVNFSEDLYCDVVLGKYNAS